MAVQAKKVKVSKPEWKKVKEKLKEEGKQHDRKKCKLDRGLTLFVGLH